jgi:hypothetical protein
MPTIVIRGTVINFPDSSASPNWAPAVIEFAQNVEAALQLAIGTYDVSPQTFSIDSYNIAGDINDLTNDSGIEIPNLVFDASQVRSAEIRISVIRNGTSPAITVTQLSEISVIYNPTGPTGNKWEIAKRKIGDATIDFYITDTGQVKFSSGSITAGTHTGTLSYSARALEQS